MTEEEVTPLFWPGASLIMKAKFICNIGDELSLWDIGGALRVYAEDGYGIWLESEEKVREHIANLDIIAAQHTVQCVSVISRNREAILVYMQMLGVEP